MKTLALCLILAAPAVAQTAKVVELSQQDAAEARSLYEQKKAIEGKIVALHDRIVQKYLMAKPGEASPCRNLKGSVVEGWGCGEFSYSENFKFIVPSNTPLTLTQPFSSWGCVTPIPMYLENFHTGTLTSPASFTTLQPWSIQ